MPPKVAFGAVHHLGAPALKAAIALVHLQQVGGEQRRLVAAGTGADFHNGRGIVGSIARQERYAQVVIQLFQRLLQFGAFFFRQRLDLVFSGGIGEQGIGVADPHLCLAIGARRLDHRRQFGMLAGELDEGLAGGARRHLAFNGMKAVQQAVQFCGGDHVPKIQSLRSKQKGSRDGSRLPHSM
jgi:hypothetical protein